MRKHVYKTIGEYSFRPFTVGEINSLDADDVTDIEYYAHEKDLIKIYALMETLNKKSCDMKTKCECGKTIKFSVKKEQFSVTEFVPGIFDISPELKISVQPRFEHDDNLVDLIEFVVLNGEQISWDDCSDKEKECVLDSIDYEKFIQIEQYLKSFRLKTPIFLTCECGKEKVIDINNADKVMRCIL
ncbi:baseplate hub protein [Morganella phage vB_Mm5]